MDSILNPPDASPASFLAVSVTLLVITTLFVAARIGTSISKSKRPVVDDYLAVFAFILTACFAALNYEYMIALHSVEPSMRFFIRLIRISIALNFLSSYALYLSKAAILVLYIRLFGIKKWLRFTCYFTLVMTFIVYFVGTVLTGVYCDPTDGLVPRLMLNCAYQNKIKGVYCGSVALATDVLILLLPLPVLAKLQLPTRKKFGLMAVFLTGIFGMIASIFSLYYKVQAWMGGSNDQTFAMLCTTIECCIALIVGCVPATAHLWSKIVADMAVARKIRSAFSRMSLLRSKKPASSAGHKVSYGSSDASEPGADDISHAPYIPIGGGNTARQSGTDDPGHYTDISLIDMRSYP